MVSNITKRINITKRVTCSGLHPICGMVSIRHITVRNVHSLILPRGLISPRGLLALVSALYVGWLQLTTSLLKMCCLSMSPGGLLALFSAPSVGWLQLEGEGKDYLAVQTHAAPLVLSLHVEAETQRIHCGIVHTRCRLPVTVTLCNKATTKLTAQ